MTVAAVHLFLGLLPMPAPTVVAEAFESITVTQTDTGTASGWQMVLRAERGPNPSDDFALARHSQLQPFTRVVVAVSMGASQHVILDGYITHVELTPVQQDHEALLTVTGDSVDAVMDVKDVGRAWPALPDSAIVLEVLATYAWAGVVPVVVPPIPPMLPPLPVEKTRVQNETDAQFLRRLATPLGHVFFVRPGPTVGMNTAYWGPPPRMLPPQKALTIDEGSATNVEAMSFAYDGVGPTVVFGAVQSEFIDGEVPVLTTVPTRLPPLAHSPAVVALLPFVKLHQYANPAFGPLRALVEANAITQQSTDRVVTVTGKLDTTRYGHILDAPGVVGVRGAGTTYDGLYYVQSVTHSLQRGSYSQDFVLTREGTGTTTQRVPA